MLFGLVRGLAVLLGRGITSAAALAAFHRRFFAWGPTVGRVTVAVEVMATALFAVVLSPWMALVLGVASIVGVVAGVRRRRAPVIVGSSTRLSTGVPAGTAPGMVRATDDGDAPRGPA